MASIHGSAVNRDGSKINGTGKVSTSWNGNVAFPRNGQYSLDLGSNPNKSITVYLDGMSQGTVFVNGSARFDVRRR